MKDIGIKDILDNDGTELLLEIDLPKCPQCKKTNYSIDEESISISKKEVLTMFIRCSDCGNIAEFSTFIPQRDEEIVIADLS